MAAADIFRPDHVLLSWLWMTRSDVTRCRQLGCGFPGVFPSSPAFFTGDRRLRSRARSEFAALGIAAKHVREFVESHPFAKGAKGWGNRPQSYRRRDFRPMQRKRLSPVASLPPFRKGREGIGHPADFSGAVNCSCPLGNRLEPLISRRAENGNQTVALVG